MFQRLMSFIILFVPDFDNFYGGSKGCTLRFDLYTSINVRLLLLSTEICKDELSRTLGYHLFYS